MKRKNILITGEPGTGKTTLVRKIAEKVTDLHPTGFYTQEIREKGTRVGFELIGFDGRNSILARVGQASPYRVGKYGVNLRGFEEFLSGMDLSNSPGLAIIDEIGKMECYSSIFRELVQDLLTSPTIILATIAQRGDSFIEEIKQRNDVQVFHVIRENRNELPEAITREIRALMEDSRR